MSKEDPGAVNPAPSSLIELDSEPVVTLDTHHIFRLDIGFMAVPKGMVEEVENRYHLVLDGSDGHE